MKWDEILFLNNVFNLKFPQTPRDLICKPHSYIDKKRAHYLLGKWCDKGLYEYGVSLDLGWLTDKGKELVRQLIK